MSDSTDANSFTMFLERLQTIGRNVQLTLITFAKMFNFRDPSNIAVIILCLTQLVMIFASFILMLLVLWKTQFVMAGQNPLNKDKLSYSAANACHFKDVLRKKIKYPYVMFPMLIVISIILIIFTLGYIASNNSWGSQSMVIYILLFACTMQTLVWIGGYLLIFRSSKKVLDSLKSKIDIFNVLVDQNMYIADAQFLATISTLPRNSVEISKIIAQALCVIKADTSTEDIVKIFFTLNVYRHFLKLGIGSDVTKDAVSSIFSKYSILFKRFGKSSNNISDYLSYGTQIIKDYSSEYVSILSNFKETDSKLPSIDMNKLQNVKKAVPIVQDLTSKANDLANDFFPDDALYSFYKMILAFVLISLLPFVIWSIYFATKKNKGGAPALASASASNGGVNNTELSEAIASIANARAST